MLDLHLHEKNMTVDGCFRIHREWGCSNTDLQPRHMPNKQAWNLELKSANMWCNKSNWINVFFVFFGLAMIHGLVMCNCYVDKRIQKLVTMLRITVPTLVVFELLEIWPRTCAIPMLSSMYLTNSQQQTHINTLATLWCLFILWPTLARLLINPLLRIGLFWTSSKGHPWHFFHGDLWSQ